MMTRNEAMVKLGQVRSKIASTQRQIQDNPKRESVAIAEAVLPSLQRKEQELVELVASLPVETRRTHWFDPDRWNDGKPFPATPPLDAAGNPDLIPDFLRRT